MYGITADELHEQIILDMRQFAAHRGIDISRIGSGDERPLEQTIRILIELALEHENADLRDAIRLIIGRDAIPWQDVPMKEVDGYLARIRERKGARYERQ